MFKNLRGRVFSNIQRHIFLVLLLFVTIFCIASYNDIAFNISANLDMLDRKAYFRRMCLQPRYSTVNLPATGLASFPGSGNTWLRYLVQESSGILTGSEYNDTDLFEDAFPAEGNTNASTILVKTHGSNYRTRELYSRVILLVRHPKDAILAEFNRNFGGGHFAMASHKYYMKYWTAFSNIHAKAWYNFYKDWLSYGNPLLVVLYNDLVSQPQRELERVLEFLKVRATPRGLKCAIFTAKKLKRPKFEAPILLYDRRMTTYLDRIYNNTLLNINRKLQGLPVKP